MFHTQQIAGLCKYWDIILCVVVNMLKRFLKQSQKQLLSWQRSYLRLFHKFVSLNLCSFKDDAMKGRKTLKQLCFLFWWHKRGTATHIVVDIHFWPRISQSVRLYPVKCYVFSHLPCGYVCLRPSTASCSPVCYSVVIANTAYGKKMSCLYYKALQCSSQSSSLRGKGQQSAIQLKSQSNC